jgi:16S rRNA (uracil1498-N3)-methyltransferase
MRNIRIYVNQPLALQEALTLDERPSHYLMHVLRLRENDHVHAFNGLGGCYVARISGISRRGVSIVPQEFIDEERESGLDLTLAHGIARGQRMDFTIQKAVELGVNRIVPLLTEHGQVKVRAEKKDTRLKHWRGVVISACEQCGRNRIPVIDRPVPLDQWATSDGNGVKLVLQPGAGQPLGALDVQPAAVTLLCGPEGGFSVADLKQATDHGYLTVSLGPRILRTETAAVAALALCQSLWGDLNSSSIC